MSKFGTPTTEQLEKINKLAKRTLSDDEVFVFSGKLAGDMIIPNRYIKLDKELLDVFSSDAKKGVSLLLDHSWSPDGFFGLGGRPKAAIPYGRTFDSKYEASTEEGETISLMSDHYMVRNVEIDGIKTNDLIASIEAGTLFDTSIGFNYQKGVCSVCGNDYSNYEKCKHFQGKTYEVEENGVTKNKLCYVIAKPPGALWENSLVFDGAYPGAGVLSKGDIVENQSGVYQVVTDLKEIDPTKQLVATYSNRTGITTMLKKSEHKKLYNLGEIEKPKNEKLKGAEKSVNEKLKTMLTSFGWSAEEIQNLGVDETNNLLDKLAEKWDSVVESIQASAEPLSVEGPTLSEGDVVFPSKYMEKTFGRSLSGEQLEKFVKEGQEYHKTLSDDAISMGVRAMGNDFPKETWEQSFANMETKSIKDIMKTWEIQANASIPSGRKTNPENPSISTNSQALPDEAFRV